MDSPRPGQRLQDAEKGAMVGVGVVEAVAPPRLAGRLHTGRIAADQFVTLEREGGEELAAAAVDQLHLVVAREGADGVGIEVDADRAPPRSGPSACISFTTSNACGRLPIVAACRGIGGSFL